jgi:hypothetical protein
MTVTIEIKDRNGISIELGQPVAMRCHRRSGNYSNWWQQVNKHHFDWFWLRGSFVFIKTELYFKPDPESEKALEAPMGSEKETQNVDHINVDIFNPANLDTVNVPASGAFTTDAE